MSQRNPSDDKKRGEQKAEPKRRKDMEPDWATPCLNCGSKPTVPATGLCGPCTFGEADTSGGNW